MSLTCAITAILSLITAGLITLAFAILALGPVFIGRALDNREGW